jgi:hypothetical protein
MPTTIRLASTNSGVIVGGKPKDSSGIDAETGRLVGLEARRRCAADRLKRCLGGGSGDEVNQDFVEGFPRLLLKDGVSWTTLKR